jgi:hypothetical protein
MMRIIVGTAGKSPTGEELKWGSVAVDELAGLASTTALFGGARTFILEGAINSERQDEFLDLADVFVESEHTFVFKEEKLLKRPTDILTKAKAKIDIQKEAPKKERGFDPFGLTFALGSRDKKKLWLGLTEAFRAGEKAEAVAGLLAWKARHMQDANLSRELTFLYHDSHRGAGDLELLLERFALKL